MNYTGAKVSLATDDTGIVDGPFDIQGFDQRVRIWFDRSRFAEAERVLDNVNFWESTAIAEVELCSRMPVLSLAMET